MAAGLRAKRKQIGLVQPQPELEPDGGGRSLRGSILQPGQGATGGVRRRRQLSAAGGAADALRNGADP